jgi:hypothetical protein
MPLIQLLEVLIVVGVLLWLVNRFIPMQSSIKSILNGVVVIAVVLWLLNVFGLFQFDFPDPHWLVSEPLRPNHHTSWRTDKKSIQQATWQIPALRRSCEENALFAAAIALSLSAFAQTNAQTTMMVEL